MSSGDGPEAVGEANREQIAYWDELAGPRWAAMHQRLDEQIEFLGQMALDRASIARGEKVLDVGCGCGSTTLALAERVGSEGSVLGLDVSTPMLAVARRRLDESGVSTRARVQRADAQTCELPGEEFDLLFSRFGVMFFQDPVAAFANLRRALRPGGRLSFVCWQAIEHNPWMSLPALAAAKHVELPPRPEPGAPGPFAFGDGERVRSILDAAGFGRVRVDAKKDALDVGGRGSLEETVEFMLQMGPASAALAGAEPGLREQVAESVAEALAGYSGPMGVRMPCAVWLVSARNPG
jgi:SAM-dependent methyltransferase